jgi:hypothetical protein
MFAHVKIHPEYREEYKEHMQNIKPSPEMLFPSKILPNIGDEADQGLIDEILVIIHMLFY